MKNIGLKKAQQQLRAYLSATPGSPPDEHNCRQFLRQTTAIEESHRHIFVDAYNAYMQDLPRDKFKKLENCSWGKVDIGRLRSLFGIRSEKQFDKAMREVVLERYFRGLRLPAGTPHPFYRLAVDPRPSKPKKKSGREEPASEGTTISGGGEDPAPRQARVARKLPRVKTEASQQWRYLIELDIDCKAVYNCEAKSCQCRSVMLRKTLYDADDAANTERRNLFVDGNIGLESYEEAAFFGPVPYEMKGAGGVPANDRGTTVAASTPSPQGGSSGAASSSSAAAQDFVVMNSGCVSMDSSSSVAMNAPTAGPDSLKQTSIRFVQHPDHPLRGAKILFTCPSKSRTLLDEQKQAHKYGCEVQTSGPNRNTVFLVRGDTLDQGLHAGKSAEFGTKYAEARKLRAEGGWWMLRSSLQPETRTPQAGTTGTATTTTYEYEKLVLPIILSDAECLGLIERQKNASTWTEQEVARWEATKAELKKQACGKAAGAKTRGGAKRKSGREKTSGAVGAPGAAAVLGTIQSDSTEKGGSVFGAAAGAAASSSAGGTIFSSSGAAGSSISATIGNDHLAFDEPERKRRRIDHLPFDEPEAKRSPPLRRPAAEPAGGDLPPLEATISPDLDAGIRRVMGFDEPRAKAAGAAGTIDEPETKRRRIDSPTGPPPGTQSLRERLAETHEQAQSGPGKHEQAQSGPGTTSHFARPRASASARSVANSFAASLSSPPVERAVPKDPVLVPRNEAAAKIPVISPDLRHLLEMGFDEPRAEAALAEAKGDVELAVAILFA